MYKRNAPNRASWHESAVKFVSCLQSPCSSDLGTLQTLTRSCGKATGKFAENLQTRLLKIAGLYIQLAPRSFSAFGAARISKQENQRDRGKKPTAVRLGKRADMQRGQVLRALQFRRQCCPTTPGGPSSTRLTQIKAPFEKIIMHVDISRIYRPINRRLVPAAS